jgi:hypothetical protein
MSRTRNLIAAIGGFLLLAAVLIGFFIVLVAPFEMVEKAAAESWPSRPGVVEKSYVSFRSGVRSAGYYSAEICGTYLDDGQPFCVDRMRYGGFRWGEGKAAAEKAAARYPPGTRVRVHYAPDNPRETVLEAVSPWTEMLILYGVGLALSLLGVVLWMLRKRPDAKAGG